MSRRRTWLGLVLIGLLALLPGCASRPAANGTTTTVASVIQNTGSDTLVNLALAWAERYMPAHPGVRISVTGGGSGTGIAALINGTTDIANASRAMKQEEFDAARKNGITPIEFAVARDAIAVVVNPSNPVNGLTLAQISDIYQGKITNWRQVGGEDRPIVLLSRESNSGTYVYFLENVLRLGQKSDILFSPDTLLMPSSEGISAEVRQNPNAIGYDGLGYVTSDQKVIAVAQDPDGPYVKPSVATVNDGSYPVSRPLFMITVGQPTGQVKDYLDWILRDGQALVVELGFVPLR
ncbi:PstS family phosphate ABC transporter substrate-binding protein [Candidatus Amarolinea dominans]|uniref:PstS family phosphate ABC transporter substrate-binding protein n=1 Tax=Candidatus Amarolinea dominans TaxID=3140696 RepID=UPI00313545B8|nr:PstS family phosphate ABC transporter substrate-binding protein [Anaerolineae bacterium]